LLRLTTEHVLDSYSNRVTVSEATGVTATITSSKGNPFALQQVQQHWARKLENTYQWFKDGVAIWCNKSTISNKYSGTIFCKGWFW
jgi:hypothetical protein